MITVTYSGPVGCGKTLAIEAAIRSLESQGWPCVDLDKRKNFIPSKSFKGVAFRSEIGPEFQFKTSKNAPPEVKVWAEQGIREALEVIEAFKAEKLASARPAGEYAILEMFGHSTLVGRICEVERFGAKMLQIEPIWQDALLPPVHVGGASIYRLTPCSIEVAFKRQPQQSYQLPDTLRATLPDPVSPKVEYFGAGDLDDHIPF